MRHRKYELQVEVSPELIADLICRAEFEHGPIEPCKNKTWRQCISDGIGNILPPTFWFNTKKDNSTHVIKIFLEKNLSEIPSVVEKAMKESINTLQW